MTPRTLALFAALAFAAPAAAAAPDPIGRVVKSDSAWKAQLPPVSYDVLRHAGTERAFTGKYWDEHRRGSYRCAGCGLELFRSGDKFDSGTGWPSFTRPVAANHVHVAPDYTLGVGRTEVRCARCDGHLGHVFEDGPEPTGQRWCMNSAALDFRPAK